MSRGHDISNQTVILTPFLILFDYFKCLSYDID